MRVLYLAANPDTTARLALGREARVIAERIRSTPLRESIEFISHWAVRPDDLSHALMAAKPHIVHFSGHATRQAKLLLDGPGGEHQEIGPLLIADLVRVLGDGIRVIILNACHTEPLAHTLITWVDCTVGMPMAVSDNASIAFAAGFYEAIGFGRSVATAFELGLFALRTRETHSADLPRLVTRQGLNPRRMFLVRSSSRASRLLCKRSHSSSLQSTDASCDARRERPAQALGTHPVNDNRMTHATPDCGDLTQPVSVASASVADLEMCQLSGGEFWLGARADDTSARPSERPPQRVMLTSFELSKYPVTQRLYESVVKTNPSARIDSRCPVHNVSFRDALSFCNALSTRLGLQPAYRLDETRTEWVLDACGYRLPTEAEWEFAAKGIRMSLFPWGDEPPLDRVCWKGKGNALGALNRKGPAPVWAHPNGATPSGLFDMAGNVWEWCWDWFAPYNVWRRNDGEPIIDPLGPRIPRKPSNPVALDGGAYRIMRGGAWNIEDPQWLRCTARSVDLETVRDPDVGFRLARGPKPGSSYVE